MMINFDDYSFHDAQILEVREIGEQTIDFTLNFPTDWKNNIFEHKVLRFANVIRYWVDEIPFSGNVTILDIKNFGEVLRDFSGPYNKWQVVRNKIELQTNAGTRTIEYTTCDFLQSSQLH